ncbi:hypothetical protein Q5N01_10840, partial [Klebsiella pneumoniae]|nr:hypothetical protein [Klebsiella pneumoniae]
LCITLPSDRRVQKNLTTTISGELNDVLLALNLSPLIHSDRDAEQLAREMILAHEKWLPNFAATIEKLKS